MELQNTPEKVENKTEVTAEKLMEWACNSIDTAASMGADPDVLSEIMNNVKSEVVDQSDLPDGTWFCQCYIDEKRISVKRTTPSDCNTAVIENMLYDLNMSKPDLKKAVDTLDSIEPKKRWEIISQGGMDNALIGHFYNHIEGHDTSEATAVQVEIQMALARAELTKDQDWNKIAEVANMALDYSKNINNLE